MKKKRPRIAVSPLLPTRPRAPSVTESGASIVEIVSSVIRARIHLNSIIFNLVRRDAKKIRNIIKTLNVKLKKIFSCIKKIMLGLTLEFCYCVDEKMFSIPNTMCMHELKKTNLLYFSQNCGA